MSGEMPISFAFEARNVHLSSQFQEFYSDVEQHCVNKLKNVQDDDDNQDDDEEGDEVDDDEIDDVLKHFLFQCRKCMNFHRVLFIFSSFIVQCVVIFAFRTRMDSCRRTRISRRPRRALSRPRVRRMAR